MKVPQDPAGAQLQSTPPLALSFATVAAIVAVAPAAIVAGGAVVNVTVMGDGVVVAEVDDETAPQPEKHTASIRTLARVKNPHFNDTRVFSTLVSSLV